MVVSSVISKDPFTVGYSHRRGASSTVIYELGLIDCGYAVVSTTMIQCMSIQKLALLNSMGFFPVNCASQTALFYPNSPIMSATCSRAYGQVGNPTAMERLVSENIDTYLPVGGLVPSGSAQSVPAL